MKRETIGVRIADIKSAISYYISSRKGKAGAFYITAFHFGSREGDADKVLYSVGGVTQNQYEQGTTYASNLDKKYAISIDENSDLGEVYKKVVENAIAYNADLFNEPKARVIAI